MATGARFYIPLQTLIGLLREAGMRHISVTAILDVQRILIHLDDEQLMGFRDLKPYIGPILCRNQADQEIYNHIFDDYAASLERIVITPARRTGDGISQLRRLLKVWPYALSGLLIALVLWQFRHKPGNERDIVIVRTITNASAYDAQMAVGDTLIFRVAIESTATGHTVSWKIGEQQYLNADSVPVVFRDTGRKVAYIAVHDPSGKVIRADSMETNIVCGHRPRFSIRSTQNGAIWNYEPYFQDSILTGRTPKYRWYINDTLIGQGNSLRHIQDADQSFSLRLVATARGLYCAGDSVDASLRQTPRRSLAAHATGYVKPLKRLNAGILAWYALLLIIAPPALAIGLKYWLSRGGRPTNPVPPKATQDMNPGTGEVQGPLSVGFKDQDYKISKDEGIRRMAEGMRRRQLTDHFRLDIPTTIRSTIAAGGFPVFKLRPNRSPADFIVLLDCENPDSHINHLFAYLLDTLSLEEVTIKVYTYYKEPLLLSNKRLNHVNLPIDKVAQLYSSSILLAFTSGTFLLDPTGQRVKSWVDEKMRAWEERFIITPTPAKDWGYREEQLGASGFLVFPADFYQNNLLDLFLDIISFRLPAVAKEVADRGENYSVRRIRFERFDKLETYLSDKDLQRWIYATAVYPHIDWRVTLAIGKALEKAGEGSTKLLTYENLLRISRISWMHDGIIDEDLRLDMLRALDMDTERVARRALLELLEEVGATFTNTSFAKEEYDLHINSNRFLVNGDRSPELISALQEAMKQQYWDWAQTVYYSEGGATLLKDEAGLPTTLEKILDKANQALQQQRQQAMEEAAEKQRKQKRQHTRIAAMMCICLWAAGIAYLAAKPLKLWHHSSGKISIHVANAALLGDTALLQVRLFTDSALDVNNEGNAVFSFSNIPLLQDTLRGQLEIANRDQRLTMSIALDSSYELTIEKPVAEHYPNLYLRYNNSDAYRTLEGQLGAALQAYNIIASQELFSDSSTISFSAGQDSIANAVSVILQSQFGIKLRRELVGAADTAGRLLPRLSLQFPEESPPFSLNEIWSGETTRRLIRFDLSNHVIYYSTGDPANFGTYAIDRYSTVRKGVYRIITRTQSGFKLFFIKNVTPAAFSLSICQDFASSRDELLQKEESACNSYDKMVLYYPKDPDKIFYPLNVLDKTNFQQSELSKLDQLTVDDNLRYDLTNFSNVPQIFTTVEKILKDKGISYLSKTRLLGGSPNPFRRYFATIVPHNFQNQFALLWVDDHSFENNLQWIQFFRNNGIVVDTVQTNEQAFMLLQKKVYSHIITDIVRDNNEPCVDKKDQAGVEFAKKVRFPKSFVIIFSTPSDIAANIDGLEDAGIAKERSIYDASTLEKYIISNIDNGNVGKYTQELCEVLANDRVVRRDTVRAYIGKGRDYFGFAGKTYTSMALQKYGITTSMVDRKSDHGTFTFKTSKCAIQTVDAYVGVSKTIKLCDGRSISFTLLQWKNEVGRSAKEAIFDAVITSSQ